MDNLKKYNEIFMKVLSDKLRETAELRLKYPELSLAELAETRASSSGK